MKKLTLRTEILNVLYVKLFSKYVYSLEFFKRLTIYQFQEYELLRFQQLLMEEESINYLQLKN